MSADLLRLAARLMRERAEGAVSAIGDEWRADSPGACLYTLQHKNFDGEWVNAFRCGPCEDWTPDGNRHGYVGSLEEPAEHIASWHPVVALAVADWLEEVAERQDPSATWGRRSHGWTGSKVANTVARAYLGRES